MDTITNITRNRNTYTIDLDTGKHIVAYLEHPFRIIGISGRELTNAPKQIDTRATLMPPPVDPAQAPTTIRHSRMVLEKLGHKSKSVVA